jgi:hypothetical protein
MRLNALFLMGSLAALTIPLSAGAVPAKSTGAVIGRSGDVVRCLLADVYEGR